MKITELLKERRLTISFEVFPPKTETAIESVREATEKIAELKPSFMSVTYGAGGGTSRYTLDIARNIKERFGVPSIAHLTCVSSTKETVARRIEDIKSAGIDNVMALRGDIPEELRDSDRSLWDYNHAYQLVRQLRESAPELCIGGACYPECHPESPDSRTDIAFLKEKVDAGCDFLTTQMFFDNSILYSFLYKIREKGILVPVIPGVMPITSATQIERAIKLSGSFMPRRFTNLVDRFGPSPDAMKQAGIAYAIDQIIDLYANGLTHVHVYSMNKPDVAERIMYGLSDIIGKKV